MEFLKENLINTTSMILVDSNTDTVENIIDKNINLKYYTLNYNSTTSCIISIEFDTPTVISNILILNHGLKSYRAWYDSMTANAFNPAINISNNSDTSSYYYFASVTVGSVQLEMYSSIVSNEEKKVGELIVSERLLKLDNNPSADNYNPSFNQKQILHEMPDGGMISFKIQNKNKFNLNLPFITSSIHNTLKTMYENNNEMVFMPFPTATSWDGIASPVVWIGQFNFKYSANVKAIGFTGSILLEEVPTR
jgi:hypothetical protein